MDNLGKLTLAVRDYGLFMFLAQACANEYKEVLYYVPWEGSYPCTDKANIGVGVPGITRVYDWNDAVRQADEVALFDVGMDSYRKTAIEEFKKPCFGGTGSVMEYDRVYFKEECLRKVGLPVSPYRVITGIDALIEYLKKNPDKWVKVNTFRGVCETFHAKDYKYSIPKIETTTKRLGSWKNKMPFIVEDHIKGYEEIEGGAIETGDDKFYNQGEPLPIGLWGFEIKDTVYCAKVASIDDMPKPIKDVDKRLLPIYKQHNLCGMMSSEIRRTKTDSFFIDACIRAGSPPAELICKLYKNFPQIVHSIANGKTITPAPIAKYGAQILLKSEMCVEAHVPMDLKDKDFDILKMRNVVKVDGQYYHIPQDNCTIIGAAVGWANNKEDAMSMALENAEKVQCDEAHFDATGFDKEREIFKKMGSVGLGTF